MPGKFILIQHLHNTPATLPTQQLQQHPPKTSPQHSHSILFLIIPLAHYNTTPARLGLQGFGVPRARVHGPLHGFRVSRQRSKALGLKTKV